MVKPPQSDKVDLEYCYSGFLGYRLVIFVWRGTELLGTIDENDKGEFLLRPIQHKQKLKKSVIENKMYKFWLWLYKNVPKFFENL